MKAPTRNHPLVLALIAMIAVVSSSEIFTCLQFKSSECIRCPVNTHAYQNQCYTDLPGCNAHFEGDKCRECDTFSYISNDICIPLMEGTALQTDSASANPGDRYGERLFAYITLNAAFQDQFFRICDNIMKKGQYGHFISRSSEPVVSVHTFDMEQMRQFKILYQGSGSGLLLCLIGINMQTNKIELRSFVTIGITQLVDLCIEYTTQSICIRCEEGYHLQSGVCYRNVPQCISYLKHICLECKGFSLLVENRCLSDCESLKDSRSIMFYHNFVTGSALPSIQRPYFQI